MKNNNDRLRRSNRILIGLIILFLLYGIIYRIQTGDTDFYLFGYKIDLPFFGNQASEETVEEEEEDSGAWILWEETEHAV